jgi:drug/metabolite transporter (DMT)-like permease
LSKNVDAYIKMAASMTIVGSFVVVNKIITAKIPVFIASELRLFTGALILLPLLFIREKGFPIIPKRDMGVLFLQAFIGVFLFSIFMLYGLKYTTAIEGGIITSTTPAMAGLISFFFLKERLTRNKIIGILLAVLGTMSVNVFGLLTNAEWTIRSLFGNTLIFGAVIGEAVFFTFGKLVSKEISALLISTMMSIMGTILFLPISIYQSISFDFSKLHIIDWLLILYSGIVVTVIAVLLMNQALTKVSGGTAAVFTSIMPISAVFFSTLFLHESFYWYHIIGLLSVLVGIIIIVKEETVTEKMGLIKGKSKDKGLMELS